MTRPRTLVLALAVGAAGLLGLQLVGHNLLLAVLYGAVVVLASLLIDWAGESSQVIVSEGLALAVVALLQVFPEVMLEATIAWARDIPNMLSNFTGANRILIGLGWPLVFFTASMVHWRRTGKPLAELRLRKEHAVEVVFLLAATLYIALAYLRGSIEILDSLELAALFVAYLYFVGKLPKRFRKLSGKGIRGVPARVARMARRKARYAILALFLAGGALIYAVVGPFYQSMLSVAGAFGLSQFLFLQWVSPFLSEFPEKASAFYLASAPGSAATALMSLVSYKLAVWTVLLAAIPLAYSAGLGSAAAVPLEPLTRSELLLTIATTAFAACLLLKLRLEAWEAAALAGLWLTQLLFVGLREPVTLAYFALAALQLAMHESEVRRTLAEFIRLARRWVLPWRAAGHR